MSNFIEWFHSNEYSTPPPELAAEIHYKLVMIHPFIDGNGRVARLLMNLIFMKHGYPPAIILKVDRRKYYRVLNEANLGKSEPYEDFIGRAIERSLILYLNSIEPDQTEEKCSSPSRRLQDIVITLQNTCLYWPEKEGWQQ